MQSRFGCLPSSHPGSSNDGRPTARQARNVHFFSPPGPITPPEHQGAPSGAFEGPHPAEHPISSWPNRARRSEALRPADLPHLSEATTCNLPEMSTDGHDGSASPGFDSDDRVALSALIDGIGGLGQMLTSVLQATAKGSSEGQLHGPMKSVPVNLGHAVRMTTDLIASVSSSICL